MAERMTLGAAFAAMDEAGKADNGPMFEAMRVVKLHAELEASKRIIWLLVHRLGGQVSLTDEEVASAPQHPPLCLIEDGRQIIAEPYIAPQGG
jgi:hypothetical protein